MRLEAHHEGHIDCPHCYSGLNLLMTEGEKCMIDMDGQQAACPDCGTLLSISVSLEISAAICIEHKRITGE